MYKYDSYACVIYSSLGIAGTKFACTYWQVARQTGSAHWKGGIETKATASLFAGKEEQAGRSIACKPGQGSTSQGHDGLWLLDPYFRSSVW